MFIGYISFILNCQPANWSLCVCGFSLKWVRKLLILNCSFLFIECNIPTGNSSAHARCVTSGDDVIVGLGFDQVCVVCAFAFLCFALLCSALLCSALLRSALLCSVLLSCLLPCCAVLCCAVLCYALLLCFAVPCRAVPCRAVPCRAVPCRAWLYNNLLTSVAPWS